MQKSEVELIVFGRLRTTAVFHALKAVYVHQVRQHARRQMVNLIRNVHVVCVFNVGHVPEVQELYVLNVRFIVLRVIDVQDDVFKAEIPVY